MSQVRELKLAGKGETKISWVQSHMPVLSSIKQQFIKEQPFRGLKVSLSIHLEAKTAYLCRVLAAGGAKMSVTGSNPLSTQDDVAAALAAGGMDVYAWHKATQEEYEQHISMALDNEPDLVLDDGADLSEALHTTLASKSGSVIGACEETTTGVLRYRQKEKNGTLKFPVIAVNDGQCKHLFDNRYGTGQSVWDGIMRTTNLVVAGKTVIVAGYGWCGKGVAMRAKGLGAKVVVTEVDPVCAIEAVMDGFSVMTMDEAACLGDIFITVTGCSDVITQKHFELMKDGAMMCNAGHFDVEVAVAELKKTAQQSFEARNNIQGYSLNGKTLYVIAEGRLVNLAAGDGHPAEIMDLSFALQALSLKYLVEHKGSLENKVYNVPCELDDFVAKLKLESLGIKIDELTQEQRRYMYGV